MKMCRFSVALLLLCLTDARADDLETQIRRFVEAYATVEREAADPVEPAKAFYEGAIPGLLRRLVSTRASSISSKSSRRPPKKASAQ